MLMLCLVRLVTGSPITNSGAHSSTTENDKSVPTLGKTDYKWNVNEKDQPLLGFGGDRLKPGFDHSLAYRLDRFSFSIFQPLMFDEASGRYTLPSLSEDVAGQSVSFAATDTKNTYAATDGSKILLVDNDSIKTIRTNDGAKYIFIRYPDGEYRCATIKESSGALLNLLYTANGLMLHGLVDGIGRSITFNYNSSGIASVTQTWMEHSQGITRTWRVGDPPPARDTAVKYSHVTALKALPTNAIVRQYTAQMAAADKLLASIFGGPNAVAGGNGFEPAGLAAVYPLYRGDVIGDDGVERRGHLSYAIHLYGSPDGTGASALYVPAGFTSHSPQPTPTDAAVTFYYPRLGNLTDVTLAVFHVADFQITNDGDRVRIGNLGGPGGSSPLYKHSHIEFYRGNTGLPSPASRASLRIDPASVFSAVK
jgi:hypothetical protein